MLALAAVLLAGCGAEATTPSAAPTTTEAAPTTSAPTTTAPAPQPVAPLTGLPVAAVEPRPALAVKIENPPVARPQAGLTEADIVWEQVVEGGTSRFVAVYQSQLPASIGPVRSTRPMDPAIAAPLHGLFATSGGQGQYLSAVSAAGLQLFSFDAGDDGFARRGRGRRRTTSTSTPARCTPPPTPSTRHRRPPSSATPRPRAPRHGRAGDAGRGLDLRLSPDAPRRGAGTRSRAPGRAPRPAPPATAADGVQVTATNVVVLRVEVVETDAVDPAGNPVPETLLAGRGGEGLVATAGRSVPVTWTKGADGDAVVLTAPDGSPVLLAPAPPGSSSCPPAAARPRWFRRLRPRD